MKYRKRPVVIEAIQWTGDNAREMREWSDGELHVSTLGRKIGIDTLEGTMVADIGDWIIRGVEGELYPCKPRIFEATYEEVEA